MKIKKIKKQDLGPLIAIWKEVFSVHNIFNKSEEEILKYLKKAKGKILAAYEDDKIVGGCALFVCPQTKEHNLARIKHIAVAKEFQGKDIGSALLKKCERIVKKGKVEIHVAEHEKDAVEFYEKNGYAKEGELKSHYREGEICYILGKVIG
ncbi:GNAT family N-acetyltransferase [Candidatus Woesearchaeota archaeon]|nr:GNAT family N-acetyltransferase [Candidatus Woesearchaeota archaeon]